jgi:hypothetical protein
VPLDEARISGSNGDVLGNTRISSELVQESRALTGEPPIAKGIAEMFTRKYPKVAALAAALIVSLVSVFAVAAATEPEWGNWPGNGNGSKPMLLEVEVSEDMNRFVFDQDVVYDDGLPAHGSAFVTFGYIYPKGTLDGSNGVLPDGSPEFPELVLGEWTCYGYMINDAAHAETGAWVISTQIFTFGEEVGAQTLVTTGYELIDIGVPAMRAISGGTGDYNEARGEVSQSLLGLNATEGVVLGLSFEIDSN